MGTQVNHWQYLLQSFTFPFQLWLSYRINKKICRKLISRQFYFKFFLWPSWAEKTHLESYDTDPRGKDLSDQFLHFLDRFSRFRIVLERKKICPESPGNKLSEYVFKNSVRCLELQWQRKTLDQKSTTVNRGRKVLEMYWNTSARSAGVTKLM